jgi:hypothetical protein
VPPARPVYGGAVLGLGRVMPAPQQIRRRQCSGPVMVGDACTRPGVLKCSLSKYGFRASGVRTTPHFSHSKFYQLQ